MCRGKRGGLYLLLLAGALLLVPAAAIQSQRPGEPAPARPQLDRRQPANYRIYYFHREPLDASTAGLQRALRAAAAAADRPVNVTWQVVDLRADSQLETVPQPDRQLWQAGNAARTPGYLVLSPGGAVLHRGALEPPELAYLLDSPARRELVRQLCGGKALVFVLLVGTDESAAAAAESLLRESAAAASRRAEPSPSPAGGLFAPPSAFAPSGPLEVSYVKVLRSDPREKWLVACLLALEADLADAPYAAAPMVFAVCGRGRALPPLIGRGIQRENLRELLESARAAGSGAAPGHPGGGDLLLAADWEQAAVGPAASSGEPSAGGAGLVIEEFLPGLLPPAPQPAATGSPAAETAKDRPADAALLKATAAGDLPQVRQRIEAGADVRARGTDGVTPLHLASGGGHREVAEALIQGVFGRDEQGRPLVWPSLERIMGAGGEAERNELQQRLSALSFDTYAQRTGALVNARDHRQQTPLHRAAEQGHFDVVNLLLDNSADVAAADAQGQTPLHLAALAGDDAVAAALLARQADPQARDKQGRTPLELTDSPAVRKRLLRALEKLGQRPELAPEPGGSGTPTAAPETPGSDSGGYPVPLGPIEARGNRAAATLGYRTEDDLSPPRLHHNVLRAVQQICQQHPETEWVQVPIVVAGSELYRLEGRRQQLQEMLQAKRTAGEIFAGLKLVEVTPWVQVLADGLREAAAAEATPETEAPNRQQEPPP